MRDAISWRWRDQLWLLRLGLLQSSPCVRHARRPCWCVDLNHMGGLGPWAHALDALLWQFDCMKDLGEHPTNPCPLAAFRSTTRTEVLAAMRHRQITPPAPQACPSEEYCL
jgi:hypothetical protein